MRYEKLTEIILQVKGNIGGHTDLMWSKYNDVKELTAELEDILDCLQRKDFSAEHKITNLFAPTGSLQEISISNGWGEAFVIQSKRIDNLLRNVNVQ